MKKMTGEGGHSEPRKGGQFAPRKGVNVPRD